MTQEYVAVVAMGMIWGMVLMAILWILAGEGRG